MNEERRIEVEEVDGVPSPPKARVGDTFERKRDYLEGFLAQQKPVEPGADLHEAVIEALKGHRLFAHITLTRSERSPIAALVTEMLEGPAARATRIAARPPAWRGGGRAASGLRGRAECLR